MNEHIRKKLQQAEESLARGNLVSAHFATRKALRSDPDNVHALILDAEINLRDGQRMASMDIVNRLFDLGPEKFDAALVKRLGHICFENELYAQAAQLFEQLRSIRRHDELTLYQSGIALRRLGDMAGAERNLLECIRLRPQVPDGHLQLGYVYKAVGRQEQAVEQYRRFLVNARERRGTAYWCLADLKSYRFSDDDIVDMESELPAQTGNPAELSALQFALGWAAEQRRDFSGAMTRYREANALQAMLKPFPAEQYRRIVAGLCGVGIDPAPPAQVEGPTAILVVGLPRSGTTLIEQILSAHSRVRPTDELPFLERIALRLEMNGGYPRRLMAITDSERQLLRTQYINGARSYFREDCDFFVDKYPGNFLHLGLIRRIMPKAVIIDVRRDLRDVAISAYRQLFGQRGEFASTFDGIREYYRGYRKLMEHWKTVLPGPIVEVRYEELVSSPKQGIQSLLQACGLEDETACHAFYEQKRAVTTPSAAQVTQPMYTSSIGRWREFEPYAREELASLGELTEQLP